MSYHSLVSLSAMSVSNGASSPLQLSKGLVMTNLQHGPGPYVILPYITTHTRTLLSHNSHTGASNCCCRWRLESPASCVLVGVIDHLLITSFDLWAGSRLQNLTCYWVHVSTHWVSVEKRGREREMERVRESERWMS